MNGVEMEGGGSDSLTDISKVQSYNHITKTNTSDILPKQKNDALNDGGNRSES